MTFECDCHLAPPTYPTYRTNVHVAPCPKADTEALIDRALIPLVEALRVNGGLTEEQALLILDVLSGWISPHSSARPALAPFSGPASHGDDYPPCGNCGPGKPYSNESNCICACHVFPSERAHCSRPRA